MKLCAFATIQFTQALRYNISIPNIFREELLISHSYAMENDSYCTLNKGFYTSRLRPRVRFYLCNV